MLQKWKTILTNWINCYFNESTTKVQNVTVESLINIISHLRENLNLDESKSSILEAHTVEEFITEKYPDFRFENNRTEPTSEEDVCVAASLLLLFVCVNSKDVDIKIAMCNKLSIEDQETIMKFSKSLMECSPISFRDVQTAITEACGQDIACIETTNGRATVAETPPALRSLHGEVRRLQAALDAERFDRNYLQEELARTNLKLEKLSKDKEQYKLDIVNLKAKISMCCGQEAESKAESGGEGSSKLMRQLQEMEERLVETQGQLDDVQYERDTYKAKIDELKQERDKWLTYSQQETARVSQLTDELETERRHVNSLKELVTELRQHNQLNRLDASQLECDDPDASLHSVHNSSVCSEVCANVVEVQLGEERAKIVVLKQQIQNLQEQLNDLHNKSEDEKQSLQRVISERENDIFNLKHRINEEIEEKNNIKAQFSDQVSRLNNEINELEQKLTDNMEHSRKTIEAKMQDIQTLQEEKLSLLQSLSNETTKLNNIISNLVTELDSEKSAKASMRDDYENKIMKLNEKVLNRNNELVELQNKISEAGERLEGLHADLRKERQARQDDVQKYGLELEQVKQDKTDVENVLQQKVQEIEELSRHLSESEQYNGDLHKTIDECKQTIAEVHENCRHLEETKIALKNEVEHSNTKVDEIMKDLENMRNKFTEENNKLMQDLDERNATINTLQIQLQNEIEYKMTIQHELTLLQTSKMALLEDINGLNSELTKLRKEILDKDKTIEGLDLYVKEEKNKNEKLKANCEKLTEQLKAATNEVVIKENHIKQVQSTLQNKTHYYDDEIRKYNESLQLEHNKLLMIIEEKGVVQKEQEYLTKEKRRLEDCVNEKCNEILQLHAECAKLTETLTENKMVIESLEQKLNQETERRVETDKAFDTETSRLMSRLNETEKSIKELRSKSNKCIEDKELQIQTLNVELAKLQKTIAADKEKIVTLQREKEASNKCIEDKELQIQTLNVELAKLQKTIAADKEKIVTLQREKEALAKKLEEEVDYRNNLEKEYQNKCVMMSDVTSQLNSQIERLKAEGADLLKTIVEKQEEISYLEEKITLLDEELKKEIQHRTQAIEILEKEKEQLQFIIEEDNSNHEVILKEKDKIIEQLEDELKIEVIQLESIQKDYEESTFAFEKYKINMQETIQAKDNRIMELEISIQNLRCSMDANANDMKIMEEQMIQHIEGLLKDVDQCKCSLAEEKAIKDTLENEKASLTEEKETLESEKISLIEHKKMLEEEISSLIHQKDELEKDKSHLIEQLNALEKEKGTLNELNDTIAKEKATLIEHKDMLEKEKSSLIEHKVVLEQKLNEVSEDLEILKIAKDSLEKENSILTQQVMEENSARAVSEEQTKILEVEKKNVEQELAKEVSIKQQLEEDKECLMQQIVEEKSAKELAEQERQILVKAKEEFESKFSHDKDNYSKQIVTLLENRALLSKEVENERTAKQALEKELERLHQESKDLKILKERFAEDNDKLREYNSCLVSDVDKYRNKYEELTEEHQILVKEKQHFEQLSEEMRAALDEIKKDKQQCDQLLEKAQESNEQFISEMKEKQEKLKMLEEQIMDLRKECEAETELNIKVSKTLYNGLEKLSENIKKENLQIDVLEKVLKDDFKSKTHDVQCECVIDVAVSLASELSLSRMMEKAENTSLIEMRDLVQEKEATIRELQSDIKKLQETIEEKKLELVKQIDANSTLETKQRDMQKLQHENQSLQNELNDIKVQLEVKVHSLKEKLIDNEHLTDKLKKTYECQIDNLNIMVNKLTNYLKDKTAELDCVRKERDRLQLAMDENAKAMKTLEEEIKTQKQNQEKLITDFENERLVLKNMVTVTESVMEDQKIGLNKLVNEYLKANEALQEQNRNLNLLLEDERRTADLKMQEKDSLFETVFKEMSDLKNERDRMIADKELAEKEVGMMKATVMLKDSQIETLESQNRELEAVLQKCKNDIALIEDNNNELKMKKDALQAKLIEKVETLSKNMDEQSERCNKLQEQYKEKVDENADLQNTISNLNTMIRDLNDQINGSVKEKAELEAQKQEMTEKVAALEANASRDTEEIDKLKKDNVHFVKIVDENKTVITNLEQLIKHELEQNQQLRDDQGNEKINLTNKCFILQEYQTKAERQLDERQKEIAVLYEEIKDLKLKLDDYEQEIERKNEVIANIAQEKDVVIGTMSKELMDEQMERERCQKELEMKEYEVERLRQKLEAATKEAETLRALRRENDAMVKAVETFPVVPYEKPSGKFSSSCERDTHHNQVDNTSDYTHSSMESLKTISDLEKIIHDKNRTITTLQSDVTYMKSLMAESENKLLDVTKELEVSKENCHQLSTQLKKIVHQKNEEIADLKKQVSKMSVTENRATQIIKVSAKYQAIILKRIAEIKNNTVLKELTNFGNTANSDNSNELRRSLNAGSVTMEDLENFLETTERHIRKCSEKQLALQKERDRLTEVNRINESEIINLKKFLTELSVSFKTFSNIKELYAQKLSRVVSIQRTVRREILSLDGQVTDAAMCKLERGYAAVMQDLSECCMNMERWVERCLGRTISPEKIKQAFSSDSERASLASTTFQNTSLEVQLGELENSFQKLLEEVMRAQKGEGAKDAQAVTVMEVRAEYEDKLSRMKAKMKQLYHEQIAVFQEKQKQEIANLEKELQEARDKLAESSKAYEEHIRALTMELWHVGQKFLVKKDEADWLRRKQRSGSLMSLQHVHSSGLVPQPEEPSRPSDTHSLRSLPISNNAISNTNTNNKREGRGLHVSDEEGEVFDNRWLKELSSTPRRPPSPRDSGMRLSELRWRNSLCPPHLKSSYPAETQFAPVVDEEDIKCAGTSRQQRKEVGITAYKKPGPPTPSKQAGRLSATDSELRESLRVEADPQPSRKTSTPSRLRALFKRNDTTEGTPRTKRLSIFRKK